MWRKPKNDPPKDDPKRPKVKTPERTMCPHCKGEAGEGGCDVCWGVGYYNRYS